MILLKMIVGFNEGWFYDLETSGAKVMVRFGKWEAYKFTFILDPHWFLLEWQILLFSGLVTPEIVLFDGLGPCTHTHH